MTLPSPSDTSRVIGTSAGGFPIHEHADPLVAAAQGLARGETDGPSWDRRHRIANVVEWAAIWAHTRRYLEQHGATLTPDDRRAVRKSIRDAESVLMDLLSMDS